MRCETDIPVPSHSGSPGQAIRPSLVIRAEHGRGLRHVGTLRTAKPFAAQRGLTPRTLARLSELRIASATPPVGPMRSSERLAPPA